MIPGVATASEVGLALRLGVSVMKFFPAELLGGARMIAALHGPFPDARFIPTGGLSPDTLAEYLRLPAVHACGGSWLAPPALIAAGDFDEITRRARAAAGTVAAIRGAAPPKD
jgi:2-dehydro-3-deoxyphosphogluconate aldolase/(4S)-4-hydroxy-2-oxoglutarate aldolase